MQEQADNLVCSGAAAIQQALPPSVNYKLIGETNQSSVRIIHATCAEFAGQVRLRENLLVCFWKNRLGFQRVSKAGKTLLFNPIALQFLTKLAVEKKREDGEDMSDWVEPDLFLAKFNSRHDKKSAKGGWRPQHDTTGTCEDPLSSRSNVGEVIDLNDPVSKGKQRDTGDKGGSGTNSPRPGGSATNYAMKMAEKPT
jgi:hypothetical protein